MHHVSSRGRETSFVGHAKAYKTALVNCAVSVTALESCAAEVFVALTTRGHAVTKGANALLYHLQCEKEGA